MYYIPFEELNSVFSVKSYNLSYVSKIKPYLYISLFTSKFINGAPYFNKHLFNTTNNERKV